MRIPVRPWRRSGGVGERKKRGKRKKEKKGKRKDWEKRSQQSMGKSPFHFPLILPSFLPFWALLIIFFLIRRPLPVVSIDTRPSLMPPRLVFSCRTLVKVLRSPPLRGWQPCLLGDFRKVYPWSLAILISLAYSVGFHRRYGFWSRYN